MLSATLEAGLSDYAIGAKIRALRLKKKMDYPATERRFNSYYAEFLPVVTTA